MRQIIVAAILVGLAGCTGTTPKTSSGSDGGGSGENTGGGTKTPAPGGTQTPGPGGTATPGPGSTPDVSGISASTGGKVGAPATSTAPKLPYKVGRLPLAQAGGILVAPGGLFEPADGVTGGEITDQFATASITGTSASTIGTWAASSLPVRVCDQELTVDHRGRFLMLGGVTQDAPPTPTKAATNTPIDKVFLGTVSRNKLTWSEPAGSALPKAVSSFGLATSSDGKTHYVVGGQIPGGASQEVRIGTSADDGSVKWAAADFLLPSARYGMALVIAHSRLYAIGGTNGSEATGEVLAARIVDGKPGEWRAVANLPAPRAYLRAFVDKGNKIVVLGGNSENETVSLASGTKAEVYVGRFDAAGTLKFEQDTQLGSPLQQYGLAVTAADAIMAGGSQVGQTKGFVDAIVQIPLSN